jgi:hypothetical protein
MQVLLNADSHTDGRQTMPDYLDAQEIPDALSAEVARSSSSSR